MHRSQVQNQLAVKMGFGASLAQQQKFIGAEPDKLAVTNRDEAVVRGKRCAACMGLHSRQHVGAATKVDLAEMRQLSKYQARLAAIYRVEPAGIAAGQGGAARRASAVLRCASH